MTAINDFRDAFIRAANSTFGPGRVFVTPAEGTKFDAYIDNGCILGAPAPEPGSRARYDGLTLTFSLNASGKRGMLIFAGEKMNDPHFKNIQSVLPRPRFSQIGNLKSFLVDTPALEPGSEGDAALIVRTWYAGVADMLKPAQE